MMKQKSKRAQEPPPPPKTITVVAGQKREMTGILALLQHSKRKILRTILKNTKLFRLLSCFNFDHFEIFLALNAVALE
jgi:hypothetical protein